jgi:probable HAF family extracellular repeat protein
MKNLCFGILLLMVAMPLAAQTKYVVNDLGGMGGDQSSAQAINNTGHVAGFGNLIVGGPNHAFRTAANSPINPATDDLGLLGGISSSASAINNLGQVAANELSSTFRPHAVLVAADGTFQNLGDMGGAFPTSTANGINDLGQVTGAAGPPSGVCGVTHAFLTQANSALTAGSDLGALRLCGNSDGLAVNNQGQVVGWAQVVASGFIAQDAMFWSSSTGMVDLGVLGQTLSFGPFFGHRATAVSINNVGQIVGTSSFNNMPQLSFTHAFLTTAAGPLQDIGTLGGNGASANWINNLSQIVGNATLAGDTALHGFIYANGGMNDRNGLIVTPGWEIVNAGNINDQGQILACGRLTATDPPFGCTHSLRLDPPGPAVSALLNQLSNPALGLTGGQVASLTDKLNNALLSIQQGLNKQATNQLNAFVNSVAVLDKNGKISDATAETLTNAANAIIATLS